MAQSEADPLARPDGYISGLDGLRAVAVSMVLVGHFGFENLIPGGLGVTIFFFISGFLITTLLMREARAHGTIRVGGFYLRRALRLYPELVLLVVIGGTAGLAYHAVRPIDVAGAFGYFTNYLVLHDEAHGGGSRWPHLWSLAVEEHFYLTFPLLVWAAWRRTRQLSVVLIAVCLLSLAWRWRLAMLGAPFGLPQMGAELPYSALASEARIDSIAYGCLTSLLLRDVGAWLRSSWLAYGLGLFGLAGLLLSLLWRDELFRLTWRYSLQGLALMGCFVGLYATQLGASVRYGLLDQPLVKRLGVLSYGAYLWHMEIVLACGAFMGRAPLDLPLKQKLMLTIGGVVVSFLLAQASFWMTAPARKLRAQLARH